MNENHFNFSACSRWFPPSGLPVSYLAFDLETTGLGGDDVPTQIGWIIVDDGKIVDTREMMLNWYSVPSIDKNWLDERMINVMSIFENRGLIYPVTIESMKGKGFPPEDCLKLFGSVLNLCMQNGWPVVGHNIVQFDLTRLPKSFDRMGIPFPTINPDLVFDTQGADVSQQLLRRGDSKGFPMPGEPAANYFSRMCSARVGDKRGSRQLTKLAFSANLPVGDDRHSALADTLLCHQMIEFWRGQPSFPLQVPTMPGPAPQGYASAASLVADPKSPATFSEQAKVQPQPPQSRRMRGQRQ